MDPLDRLFHADYAPARAAFRRRAAEAGFELTALELGLDGPDGSPLTIDVAVKASGPIRRATVISSGTHGVEGYFGSAVQLDLLGDRLKSWSPAPGEGVVLIHAVNPWGMAHKRRVDAEGIDLNRNFLQPGKDYRGAPDGYVQLNHLLNPTTPPSTIDLFLPRTAVQLLRHGFNALKEAVASGQYDYPRGVFFGGKAPSRSLELLAELLPALLGEAEVVRHIDLHTGMGTWCTYVLAVDLPNDHPQVAGLRDVFGEVVQGLDPSGVLYTIHGALGGWLQALFPTVQYDAMLAEYGTYNPIQVIMAMRYENRVFLYTDPDDPRRQTAKDRMVETFCPADPRWRRTCVDQARAVADRAIAATCPGT